MLNSLFTKIIANPISIKIVTVLLNFLSNAIINRFLGLELRGDLTVILNYAIFIQLLLNGGVCYSYSSLKREVGKNNCDVIFSTIFWIQFIIYGIIFSIVSVYLEQFNSFYTFLLALVMITNNQFLFIALVDDIRKRNLTLLFSSVAYFIINIIICSNLKSNIYPVLNIMIFKYIFETLWIAYNKNYFTFSMSNLSSKLSMQIIKISVPTALMAFLISVSYNVSIFIMDFLNVPKKELGIYGVAFSLLNMMWFIPDAFKEMVYNKSDKTKNYKFILHYIIVNLIICSFICFAFYIVGKQFLQLVYGKEYVESFYVCIILFLSVLPMISFKLIHPLYVNLGRPKPVILLLLIIVLLNAFFSFILIPYYGALGASIATLISYSICGISFFIKFYKDFC